MTDQTPDTATHWGPDPGHGGLTQHKGTRENCAGPDCGEPPAEQAPEPAGIDAAQLALYRGLLSAPINHAHAPLYSVAAHLLAEVDRLKQVAESWADRCEGAWTERDQAEAHRDRLRRQLDAAEAAPAEVWLIDNEFAPPTPYATQLGARAAAISSWVDDNPDPGYAAPFSFIAIAPDGDTDLDCAELVANGRATGTYVTRMTVQTAEPTEAEPRLTVADIAGIAPWWGRDEPEAEP